MGGLLASLLAGRLGSAAPAQAAGARGAADGAIAAIEHVAPDVLTGAQLAPSRGRVLPADPTVPLRVTGSRGALDVTVPFAEQARSSSVGDTGMRVYENGNGSSTVPVRKADGSVQITTVIDETQAPASYAYDIGVPDGASLRKQKGGGVAVIGPEGEFLGGAAAPWAKASDGSAVPTRYEIDGNKLVQEVDHRGLPESAYPVVADPWLGQDLLYQPYVTDHQPEGYKVNVTPTPWGRANLLPFTHPAHVLELKTQLGRDYHKVTPTVEEQFKCHVAFNFGPGAEEFNMESWLIWMRWDAQRFVRCNPPPQR
ncbi:DUF2599 domain-containing protein [Streptomyces acidicola]|uniref:DUF2599 domain-containing protein n=1 Tax=Streptomyces acidicola TaxID=2596892 RepID=UPI00382ECCC7